MIITFDAVGILVLAKINNAIFYKQVGELFEGNSILYGNTAESMGVATFQLVISYD